MTVQDNKNVSRRKFLRIALAFGGTAAAASILQACGATATPTQAPAPPAAAATKPPAAPTAAPAAPTAAPAAPTAAPAAPTKPAAAASDVKLQDNGQMQALWGGPINNFNPLTAVQGCQTQFFSSVFMSLTMLNPEKTDFLPDLADSWTASPDATEYTFKLNKNAKWHNGKPLTAQDVEFTYLRALNPATKSRFATGLNLLKGGADFTAGKATTVPGIQVIDDQTIKFITAYPTGQFMYQVQLAILPKHLLGDVKPEDLEKHPFFISDPVGSGPFKFVKYVTDQYLEVEANPDYVRGKPKLGKIIFRIIKAADTSQIALQRGEIDWNSWGGFPTTPEVIDTFAKDANFNVVAITGTVFSAYWFNVRKDFLKDPRVRQAWWYAIDRKKLISSFLGGNGVTFDTPLIHSWIQKDLKNKYDYNPDKAKQLLKDANWDTNRVVTISVISITSESDRALHAAAQQMLEAVGIKVKIQEFESAVWVEKFYESHDFEAVYVGAGSFADPDGFLKFHMVKDSKNAPGYADYAGADFAGWIDQAGKLVDPAKRKELYLKVQDKLNEDPPIAVMWVSSSVYILNKKIYIPFLTEGAKVKDSKNMPVLPIIREFYVGMEKWGVRA